MFYQDQPDLRPAGFEPLYMLDNGVINRSIYPEGDHLTPPPSGVNPKSQEAFSRVARASIGVEEDIWQHIEHKPKAYNKTHRALCIDFENAEFINPLDAKSLDSRKRVKHVDHLVSMIKVMKDEALLYNKNLLVGSYCPLYHFANLYPSDPIYAGMMAVTEVDMKPLSDALDVSFPPCEIHTKDLEKWKSDTRGVIDYLAKVMPGKPVFPVVPPYYAHYAPEEYRWYLMSPTNMWIPAITWLMEQPEVNGMVMYGGFKFLGEGMPDYKTKNPWNSIYTFAANAIKIAKSS